MPHETISKQKIYTKILSAIPQSKSMSKTQMQWIVSQASIYTEQLKSELPDIFERRGLDDQHHDGRYFDLIPILILTAMSTSDMSLSPETLYEIMALTVYQFEIDDFIEHVLEASDEQFQRDLDIMLHLMLSKQDHTPSLSDADSIYSDSDDSMETSSISSTTTDALLKLQRFIDYHILHPAVLVAPSTLQSQLRSDLASFIKAGVRQSEHSKIFFTTGQLPNMNFYDWLYSTSIVNSGGFPWCTILQALFAQSFPSNTAPLDTISSHLLSELRTHIAVKYRFTNDRTSLYRDRKEKNLNCVDFPEFGFAQGDEMDDDRVGRVRSELLALEAYEERMCDGLLEALEERRITQLRKESSDVKAVRLFRAVEVIHGVFYELKSHKP